MTKLNIFPQLLDIFTYNGFLALAVLITAKMVSFLYPTGLDYIQQNVGYWIKLSIKLASNPFGRTNIKPKPSDVEAEPF